MKKKTTVTAEEIAHFLEQTGFVFEMRMNELFEKANYNTKISAEFLDLEHNIPREIDIVASKIVNDIHIHFIVECKQSLTDKWVIMCNKRVPRLYRLVKHLPRIDLTALRDDRTFANLHQFDRGVPLGHNYLCYTIIGNKKAEHKQIDECVNKLPKALLSTVASEKSFGDSVRHLFLPLALFSGQLFSANYNGKLVVDERPFLQYFTTFRAEAYAKEIKTSDEGFQPFYSPLERLLGGEAMARGGDQKSCQSIR